MKKILFVLLFAIISISAMAINFTEALHDAMILCGGMDELILEEENMMLMIVPVHRQYITSEFVFGDATNIFLSFIGSNYSAFVYVENTSGSPMRLPADFIALDGNYGEGFINSNIKMADYIDIEPYSSNYGFLVVDPFLKYPIITIGQRYARNYIKLDSKSSFIHRYILICFENRD